MRLLRDWGEETRYEHKLKGFNYRMDGIQGAILRVKLRHLEAWTEARRARAAEYRAIFRGQVSTCPSSSQGAATSITCMRYGCAIATQRARTCSRAGIQTGVHYPIPVHLQPAYSDLGYVRGDFPVAERVAAEVLSLPMFPEMTTAQVEQVACGGAGGAAIDGRAMSGRIVPAVHAVREIAADPSHELGLADALRAKHSREALQELYGRFMPWRRRLRCDDAAHRLPRARTARRQRRATSAGASRCCTRRRL